MTQQNVTQLSFVPGSLIISKHDAKPYLVLSLPSLLRPLQQVIKVAPIERDLLAMKCKKAKHIVLPTTSKVKGIICLHQEKTLNCTDLQFVDKLNDPLLTYVLSQVKAENNKINDY